METQTFNEPLFSDDDISVWCDIIDSDTLYLRVRLSNKSLRTTRRVLRNFPVFCEWAGSLGYLTLAAHAHTNVGRRWAKLFGFKEVDDVMVRDL